MRNHVKQDNTEAVSVYPLIIIVFVRLQDLWCHVSDRAKHTVLALGSRGSRFDFRQFFCHAKITNHELADLAFVIDAYE